MVVIDGAVLVVSVVVPVVSLTVAAAVRINLVESHHLFTEVAVESKVKAVHDLALHTETHSLLVSKNFELGATKAVKALLLARSLVVATFTVLREALEVEVKAIVVATIGFLWGAVGA